MRIQKTLNLELIKELDAICFAADSRLPEEDLRACIWWIACNEKGEAIGYAGLWPLPSDNKCFLSKAGVLPDYRGSGVQKALVRARLKHAKKLGLSRCYTYVYANNLASMRSLLACGLKPYWHTYGQDGSSWIYLESMPKSAT